MGTPTYTAIASQTLTSSASSVTFSSIPSTYRDLVLVWANGGASTYAVGMVFNSDSTATNYHWISMSGDGSSAASATSNTNFFSANYGSGVNTIQVMDYSATDKHKSALTRINGDGGSVQARAGRWANTSAITSWQVFANATTFPSGATFSLYGIAA